MCQFLNFAVLQYFNHQEEKAHQILISEKLYVNVNYYNLPMQATAENLYESQWK